MPAPHERADEARDDRGRDDGDDDRAEHVLPRAPAVEREAHREEDLRDQERPEAGHEPVAGEHEEDVAGQRQHERGDEPVTDVAVHRVERRGHGDQRDRRRRLAEVLPTGAFPGDGDPVAHREHPADREEDPGRGGHDPNLLPDLPRVRRRGAPIEQPVALDPARLQVQKKTPRVNVGVRRRLDRLGERHRALGLGPARVRPLRRDERPRRRQLDHPRRLPRAVRALGAGLCDPRVRLGRQPRHRPPHHRGPRPEGPGRDAHHRRGEQRAPQPPRRDDRRPARPPRRRHELRGGAGERVQQRVGRARARPARPPDRCRLARGRAGHLRRRRVRDVVVGRPPDGVRAGHRRHHRRGQHHRLAVDVVDPRQPAACRRARSCPRRSSAASGSRR